MSKEQKTAAQHAAVIIIFFLYLVILLYMLFLSDRYGRTTGYTEYHYNLKPFAEIRRYLQYRSSFDPELFMINIVGNVAAFFPFGFLYPQAVPERRAFWKVTLRGFVFSLMIETMQLVLMVGIFDVDDIILNVSGVMLGYAVFAWIFHHKYGGKK